MAERLLTVCIITYNHYKFIEKAISSVLFQKTSFKYDIIIADDFSTDGTREILLAFEKNNKGIINLILQPKNVGAAQNWLDLITASDAKYIAYFEGDDYWTDQLKLQKQVDFLENNPDYSFTFHNVHELDQRSGKMNLSSIKTDKATFAIEELARGNFIHTVSVVYRNKLFTSLPPWILDCPIGDYVLHMLNARYGKIGFFPEPMAVYRMHNNGTWTSEKERVKQRKIIKALDYILTEFRSEKSVYDILRAQQMQTANQLVTAMIYDRDFNGVANLFNDYGETNSEWKHYWLTDGYPSLINRIFDSKTYRVGKTLAKVPKYFGRIGR